MSVNKDLRVVDRLGAVVVGSVLMAAACSIQTTESGQGDLTQPTIGVALVETTAPSPVPEEADTTAPQDEAAAELPASPQELAAELNRVELCLAESTDESPVEVTALGRYQQALYAVLDRNPSWESEVIAGIDQQVRPIVDLHWLARQSLSALVDTEAQPSELPAWRIVEPLSPEELLGFYRRGEDVHGIDWEYLAAINLVETRMGRIQGVSSAGAQGPMQFLPTTWAECCQGDPTVPSDAIVGAAKYLTDRGGPGDMQRAILGYNNSQFYVDAVVAYADALRLNPSLYMAYHGWVVYFRTTEGLIVLPDDYDQPDPIAVADWLAANPETLFPASE